jgi:hypothetical protein
MGTLEHPLSREAIHPVRIHVEPAFQGRNRLTTAFRLILAFPHLLLVGGPIALALSWSWSSDTGTNYNWGAGGGVHPRRGAAERMDRSTQDVHAS